MTGQAHGVIGPPVGWRVSVSEAYQPQGSSGVLNGVQPPRLPSRAYSGQRVEAMLTGFPSLVNACVPGTPTWTLTWKFSQAS
jgi:hypothetical protein